MIVILLDKVDEDKWWNFIQKIIINAEFQIGKRDLRAELTGRSPFRN
jgi:hypothetical protein